MSDVHSIFVHPTLAQMATGLAVGLIVAAAIVGAAVVLVAIRMMGGKTIADAKTQAKQIVDEAQTKAKSMRDQAELDARQQLIARREEVENEINATRNELKDTERRLSKREDNLDRKLDTLTTKEKNLDQLDAEVKKREKQAAELQEQLKNTLNEQREKLLSISNMSEDEAKRQLLQRVEEDIRHDAGLIVQRELAKAEETAKENSMKVTLQAIQRFAAEHTSTSTVSSVEIPSDDMKGRVIGREGRNIRAFEQSTGVDVIVDDTPGVVVVSCFDPVRRAVAAEALERLIADGRIHPTRIEEIVEKVREEMEERLRRYGKEASIEANVQSLHPKIEHALGRLHYRTSYGQNILRHSMEVAYLCQVIADELGLDGHLARRCGLLHDIGKALDHEIEGSHPEIGMEFARKFGENEEAVLNAIAGHHGDIEASTPYTPIVMAADAISGARPGARRETLERYVKRLQQLESIATDMEGVREAFAIQAGREVRVIVDSKKLSDAESTKVARDIAKRVEEEMTYPGEVRVTVLRELRSVEYAR